MAPHRENRQTYVFFFNFWDFFGPWKKLPQMAPNRAGMIFVPTNPDLADILGRTDFNFDNFHILNLLDPKFLDFQVSRSKNSQMSRFPDFQTPPAPAPLDPDELSDPNLTPSQRIQGPNTSQGPLLQCKHLSSGGINGIQCHGQQQRVQTILMAF